MSRMNSDSGRSSGGGGRTQAKLIFLGVAAVTVLIIGIWVLRSLAERNDVQEWRVRQSLFGHVDVVDSPGYFMKAFGKTWVYPRSIQTFYSSHPKEGKATDESIGVTFNDGGTAQVSTMVRFTLPTDEDNRIKIHRTFGNTPDADGDPCKAVTDAVRAHLVNCLKNSAPLMSASENQAGRKAEFNEIVEAQLRDGLYEMKRLPTTFKDENDPKGQSITVEKTEIVRDDKGRPLILQSSPLKDYGIIITQFSVTGTDYDAATLAQFAAKKESYLAAEKSKAQQNQEVQQRLMTVEKGLREKAEVEAEANKVMAKVETEAKQKVAVAQQAKLEAETLANQKWEVAKIEKDEALTAANRKLEVAQLEAKAAEQNAKAIITMADAEKQKIANAGAITEKERVLAQIRADRDVKVAEHLSQIRTPSIIMGGAGGSGGPSAAADWQGNLMNLVMLRMAGIDIHKDGSTETSPAPAAK